MNISGILESVRGAFFSLFAAAIVPASAALLSQTPPTQTPPARPTPQAVAPIPSIQNVTTVVIDPAHGGGDSGARGAGGTLEKDVVLALARVLRSELQKQGLQVVLTREGDDDRTFDARAATGNAPRRSIFLSLHVGSVGAAGTARAYYFPAPTGEVVPITQGGRLVPWERAQEPFAAASRRLAELAQVQLGQRLRGSPEVPAASAVRQLRIVAAPAIALEVSNIAAEQRELLRLAPALAEGIARGVAAFLPTYMEGAR